MRPPASAVRRLPGDATGGRAAARRLCRDDGGRPPRSPRSCRWRSATSFVPLLARDGAGADARCLRISARSRLLRCWSGLGRGGCAADFGARPPRPEGRLASDSVLQRRASRPPTASAACASRPRRRLQLARLSADTTAAGSAAATGAAVRRGHRAALQTEAQRLQHVAEFVRRTAEDRHHVVGCAEPAVARRALGRRSMAGRRSAATQAAAGSDRRGARECRGAPRADRTRESRWRDSRAPGIAGSAATDVRPGRGSDGSVSSSRPCSPACFSTKSVAARSAAAGFSSSGKKMLKAPKRRPYLRKLGARRLIERVDLVGHGVALQNAEVLLQAERDAARQTLQSPSAADISTSGFSLSAIDILQPRLQARRAPSRVSASRDMLVDEQLTRTAPADRPPLRAARSHRRATAMRAVARQLERIVLRGRNAARTHAEFARQHLRGRLPRGLAVDAVGRTYRA